MFDTDIGEDRQHSSSFAYISIPLYALRELWLSLRSREWVPVEATIQSCSRTVGGYRETIRVEVWYGYKVNGEHYAGHLIRDRGVGGVQRVVDSYPSGKTVLVRVNPENANESFLPSGIGYVEPFFVGIISLMTISILLLMVAGLIVAPIIDRFRR
jgi:hypothetical protein